MTSQQPYANRDAAFDAFAKHVSKGKVQRYKALDFDAMLGAREGAFFFDAYNNRRWFNCHCNGGLFNLGHRHPRIVKALQEALQTLDIGNHHLVSGYRARLAERLSATTSGQLSGVVFGSSGGESIDLAIKVARGVTGKTGIVSALGGYHGHTGLAMATGDPQYRDPFGPNLPGFTQAPFDDLAALEQAMDANTAAVILETIPATLGMPLPSPGYLQGVQKLCQAKGAKLILDEVQSGLGRTGKMWAYQHDAVQPDAVVTGKGLSGGMYPITATLLSPELQAFMDDKPSIHISTFGGAELGCIVAMTVLDILEEPGFLGGVSSQGNRFKAAFEGLPFTTRQRGLMMGLKFPFEDGGLMATKMFYDAGIFAVWANNDTSVLQFLPPMILTEAQMDELIHTIQGLFQ